MTAENEYILKKVVSYDECKATQDLHDAKIVSDIEILRAIPLKSITTNADVDMPIALPSPIISEVKIRNNGKQLHYTDRCGEIEYLLPEKYRLELQELIGDESISELPVDMVFTRIGESGIGIHVQQNSVRVGFLKYLSSCEPIDSIWRPAFTYVSVFHQYLERAANSSAILAIGDRSAKFAAAYAEVLFPEKNIVVTTCPLGDRIVFQLNAIERENCAGFDSVFCFETITQEEVLSIGLFIGGFVRGVGLVCLPYADTSVTYDPVLTNIKALYSNNFKVVLSTKTRHLGLLTDFTGITVWKKNRFSSLAATGISDSRHSVSIEKFGDAIVLEQPSWIEYLGPEIINTADGPFDNITSSSDLYERKFEGFKLTHITDGAVLNPHGVVVSSEGILHSDFINRLHRSEGILSSSQIFDKKENFFIAVSRDAACITDCILVLDTPSYYFNYWHWTHEFLPRLKSVLVNTDSSIPVLIPPLVSNFQKQSLYSLKDADKRVFSLTCPAIKLVNCKVLSFGNDQAYLSRSFLDARDDLLNKLGRVKSKNLPSRRIFISRAAALGRRILNEAQMTEILKKHGFEIIQTEQLTMSEQVNLFWNTSHIVSMEGAGFANLMFCQKSAKAFAIHTVNSVADRLLHYGTANVVGMGYSVFGCSCFERDWDIVSPNVEIDIDSFGKALSKWLVD